MSAGLRRHKQLAATIVAALMSFISLSASAQDGVQAGDLTLHPSIRLGTGFDSNLIYRDSDEDSVTALRLNITPAVSAETRTPRDVDFSTDLSAQWQQVLSESQDGVADQSGLALRWNAQAMLNPRGLVSVTPRNELNRTNRAAFDATGDPFRVLQNTTRLTLGLHPGGGLRSSRMGISGELGGFYRIADFSNNDDLNRNEVGGETRWNWNFLPKTAVFVTGSVSRVSYKTNTLTQSAEANDGTTTEFSILQADATNYRVSGGLSGLLLPRLSLLLRAGYGAGNYQQGSDVSGLLFEGRIQAQVTPSNSVRLGFRQDFANANLGNGLTYRRVYLGAGVTEGVLSASLEGFYQWNVYDDIVDENGDAPTTIETQPDVDTLVGVTADVGFSLSRYLTVGASYQLETRNSDYVAVSLDGASTSTRNFVRNVAFLYLQARY